MCLGGWEEPTMPKHKKRYWQKYDMLYKNCSKKRLFKQLKASCENLGCPYEKKGNRGRSLKFSPIEYAAFISLQKMFGHKSREMELEADLFLSDKADHSTFARNYKRIPTEYIEKLIIPFVKKKYCLLIADSTAMSTKIRVERIKAGTRNKQKLTNKFHILVGYDPEDHEVMILGVKATDNHTSDSKGACMILNKLENPFAYFFGDSAYHTYELHNIGKEKKLIVMTKPDKKGIRKKMSAKAINTKKFNERLYKEIRGIVETVFGGLTNAGLITTFAKTTKAIQLDTLMLALRHNLMTSIRLYKLIMRQTLKYGTVKLSVLAKLFGPFNRLPTF